jgi:hypothetical protein
VIVIAPSRLIDVMPPVDVSSTKRFEAKTADAWRR